MDIRRELKPFLADLSVTDEKILKHEIKVTSEESKRHYRLGSTQRGKHVSAHVAQAEEGKAKQTKKETADQKTKVDTIKQLEEKIDTLPKVVDILAGKVQKECSNSLTRPSATKTERLYSCPNCVQAGSKSCFHCFSCGEEGHRAIGCLKRPKREPVAAEGQAVTGTVPESHLQTETAPEHKTTVNQTKAKRQRLKNNRNETPKATVGNKEQIV